MDSDVSSASSNLGTGSVKLNVYPKKEDPEKKPPTIACNVKVKVDTSAVKAEFINVGAFDSDGPIKKKVKQEEQVQKSLSGPSVIIDLADDNSDDDIVECIIPDPAAESNKPKTFVAVDDVDDEAEIKMTTLPYQTLMRMLVPPTKLVPNSTYVPPPRFKNMYKNMCEFRLNFSIPEQDCDLIYDEKIKAEVYLRFCCIPNDFKGEENKELDDSLLDYEELIINEVPFYADLDSDLGDNPESSSIKCLNITSFVGWSSHKKNQIIVRWIPDEPPETYAISVSLWKPMSVDGILESLSSKTLPVSETKQKIKDILCTGEEISAPDSTIVSLKCPLGRDRIKIPCRGLRCTHIQCFDAEVYLKMVLDLKKICKQKCPICNNKMEIDELRIDSYFQNILNRMKQDKMDSTEVQILADARWSAM